jgi:hypothetical protein
MTRAVRWIYVVALARAVLIGTSATMAQTANRTAAAEPRASEFSANKN